MKSTAILEISAILPFTHNRFGRQMDLSKIIRSKRYFGEVVEKKQINCRVSVQPALCTDLKVEGSMADR